MAAASPSLSQVLQGLLQPTDAVRVPFERAYQERKLREPDVLLEDLAQFLAECPSESAAELQLCAVLLRRALEDETPAGGWARLGSEPRRTHLRAIVLLATEKIRGRGNLRAATHVVAQLSRLSFHGPEEYRTSEGWNELFVFMHRVASAPQSEPDLRETGFNLFAKVAEYAPKAVAPYSVVIGQILSQGLGDPSSVEVRLASLRALASLLISLEPSQLEPFRATTPLMLDALQSALDHAAKKTPSSSSSVEADAREALQALVDMVTQHPKLLKPHFELFANSMVSIATAPQLESATRILGLEFLVSAATSMPSVLRKHVPQFAAQLVPLCMRLMCEGMNSNPDVEVWEASLGDKTDEDEEDDEIVLAAEEAAHRLAMALGGKTVLPAVLQLVPTLAKDDKDWRSRRVAVQILSLIAEGCGKKMYAKLDDVLAFAQQVLGRPEPHVRVRYAVVHLLGGLCLDFGEEGDKCGGEGKPTFQKKSAEAILRVFASTLQDPSPRVALHTVSSLVNFFTEFAGLTLRDVSEHLEPILTGLLRHLMADSTPHGNSGAGTMQLEALMAISSIATVVGGDAFARFYDTLMPVVLNIAANSKNNNNNNNSDDDENAETLSELRGHALECAGLMAASVGKARFAPHAPLCMQLILQACRQKNDPTMRRYAIAASVRVAEAVKEDFYPFLPELMPELLRGCDEDVSPTFIDPEMAKEAEERGFQVFSLEVRGEGLKSLQIDSSAVQEVCTCVFALYNLALQLEQGFAPWAPSAVEHVLPLIKCEWVDAVRNVAIVSLPHFLTCMTRAVAVAVAAASTASNNHPQERAVLANSASQVYLSCLLALIEKLNEQDDQVEELAELDDLGEFNAAMDTMMHIAEALVMLLRVCYESGGAKDNDPFLEKRVDRCPPLYDGHVSEEQFEHLAVFFSEALQRRVQVIQEYRDRLGNNANEEDGDEVTEEQLSAILAQHVEIADRLVDCNGYLIKIVSAVPRGTERRANMFGSLRRNLIPLAQSLTQDQAPDECKRLGVCILDDYTEFGPDGISPEVEQMCLDVCLRAVASSPHDGLVRAAVWGIGICAQYASSNWIDARAADSIQALKHAIESRVLRLRGDGGGGLSDDEERFDAGLVMDNAISALEKWARYRGPALVSAGMGSPEAMLTQLFHVLPCTTDAEEAKVVNVQLKRYAGTPVLSTDRYFRIIVAQLAKGYDQDARKWVEEDAFLHERTRMEFAQEFARGAYAAAISAGGLSQEEMNMLSELGIAFASSPVNT